MVHRYTLALLVALAAIVGLTPGSASAENSVVNSSPSNGAVLNVSPDEIVIGFADELERAQNQSTAMEARARAAVARLQEVSESGAAAAPAAPAKK